MALFSEMMDAEHALWQDLARLRAAANALYEAGVWTCDRPVNEALLWEKLRDALGREPGTSPGPVKHDD